MSTHFRVDLPKKKIPPALPAKQRMENSPLSQCRTGPRFESMRVGTFSPIIEVRDFLDGVCDGYFQVVVMKEGIDQDGWTIPPGRKETPPIRL